MKKVLTMISLSLLFLTSTSVIGFAQTVENPEGQENMTTLYTSQGSETIEINRLLQVDDEQNPWLIRARVVDGLTGEELYSDYYLSQNTPETTINQIHEEYLKDAIQIDAANTELLDTEEIARLDNLEGIIEVPTYSLDMQVWEFEDANGITANNMVEIESTLSEEMSSAELDKTEENNEISESLDTPDTENLASKEFISEPDQSSETQFLMDETDESDETNLGATSQTRGNESFYETSYSSDTNMTNPSQAESDDAIMDETDETDETQTMNHPNQAVTHSSSELEQNSVESQSIENKTRGSETVSNSVVGEINANSDGLQSTQLGENESEIESNQVADNTLLPATGEENTSWLLIFAAVILLIGIGLIIFRRRK